MRYNGSKWGDTINCQLELISKGGIPMFYRYHIDNRNYEVVDKRGRVVCVCNTEQEAQKITNKGEL